MHQQIRGDSTSRRPLTDAMMMVVDPNLRETVPTMPAAPRLG